MSEFALTHAWLIPLLPALAFVVIGLFTRLNKKLSEAIAVSAISLSFLVSLCVLAAVIGGPVTMDNPFIQKALWAKMQR